MAYALSWISVAGGDSVMPPWVRMQFPQAGRIVRHLRDTNCGDPGSVVFGCWATSALHCASGRADPPLNFHPAAIGAGS